MVAGVPAMQADGWLVPPRGGLDFIHPVDLETGVSMRIIPRSKNQSIVISDSIIVNVLEVEDDEVRLSIEYTEGVSVQPGEVVAEQELAVKEPAAV